MNVLVSINCITYNHEKYISDALEGFLNQITDFDFEIVVGEDCSTDNTRKIIEEYVKKYPEKIILITSEKNVGVIENERRIYQASSGKYIAVCEGDDFWIDPYKLQKQINYMEKNKDCTLCFHNAYTVNINRNRMGTMIPNDIENRAYDCGEIAVLGFIPTASKVYLKSTMSNIPEWYKTAIVEDFPSQLIITSKGYAYYMKDIMSAYRTGVENSATYTLFHKLNNEKTIIENQEKLISLVDDFNIYSQFKYSEKLLERRKLYEYQLYFMKGDIKKLKESRYEEFFKVIGIKSRVGLYLKAYMPQIYRPINRIYRPIKCKVEQLAFGKRI